jgi:CheY-like chemotaxis protein
MLKLIKLLWIDDNLDQDLTEKRMALYMEDDFDPHFARDASEAYDMLANHHFDNVIVDLRLPPGPHDRWNDAWDAGFRKFGIELLRCVFSSDRPIFQHLHEADTRFGVFTIEAENENTELFEPPIGLPKANFKMKTNAYYENDFVDFIRNLLPMKVE